jgi:hypothetical protein
VLESIGVRERPMWARGPAHIDGEDIVLEGGAVELYTLPNSEHGASLLFDLGNLGKLGEIVHVEDPSARLIDAVRLRDTDRAMKFAGTHGLLRHGPAQVGKGEVRESLKSWYLAGLELAISTEMYSNIRRFQEKGSAKPLRSYLQTLRDAGIFGHFVLSDNDSELAEYASIQLAERLTRGMTDCTPTFSAVCGLLKDGEKAGLAGDFRFGNNPGSLVGAANYQLAWLISRKVMVRDCEECGEMLIPTDPRQRYHPKCGNRKRKRVERQKQKAEAMAAVRQQ